MNSSWFWRAWSEEKWGFRHQVGTEAGTLYRALTTLLKMLWHFLSLSLSPQVIHTTRDSCASTNSPRKSVYRILPLLKIASPPLLKCRQAVSLSALTMRSSAGSFQFSRDSTGLKSANNPMRPNPLSFSFHISPCFEWRRGQRFDLLPTGHCGMDLPAAHPSSTPLPP